MPMILREYMILNEDAYNLEIKELLENKELTPNNLNELLYDKSELLQLKEDIIIDIRKGAFGNKLPAFQQIEIIKRIRKRFDSFINGLDGEGKTSHPNHKCAKDGVRGSQGNSQEGLIPSKPSLNSDEYLSDEEISEVIREGREDFTNHTD